MLVTILDSKVETAASVSSNFHVLSRRNMVLFQHQRDRALILEEVILGVLMFLSLSERES